MSKGKENKSSQPAFTKGSSLPTVVAPIKTAKVEEENEEGWPEDLGWGNDEDEEE